MITHIVTVLKVRISSLQQLCARSRLDGVIVWQALRKVLAGSRPMDLPQLLRPMAPAERAAWLLLHGVPTLVQVRHTVCRARPCGAGSAQYA